MTVSYDDAKSSFLGFGMPLWLVEGLLEKLKAVDQGTPSTSLADINDVQRITGEPPISLEEWVPQILVTFQ